MWSIRIVLLVLLKLHTELSFIMTVAEIFARYHTPSDLQRHQREVAMVASYLSDHWQGNSVNKDLLIQSALLHDLGNLVKFQRPFLGNMGERAEYWQKVQDEQRARFGQDAKQATLQMVDELGLGQTVGAVLRDMEVLFAGGETVRVEAQLVECSDLMVTPEGIVGYERRKRDLIDRYGASHGTAWVEPADRLYQFVCENVSVELANVAEVDWADYAAEIDGWLTRAITA